jgi:hypothetical protein
MVALIGGKGAEFCSGKTPSTNLGTCFIGGTEVILCLSQWEYHILLALVLILGLYGTQTRLQLQELSKSEIFLRVLLKWPDVTLNQVILQVESLSCGMHG